MEHLLWGIGFITGCGVGVLSTSWWLRRIRLNKLEREKEPEHVDCEHCGALVLREKAQCVKWFGFSRTAKYYYCSQHRRNYTSINDWGALSKEFFVSEDGTPIGYQKIVEKKKVGRPRKS